MSSTRSRRDAPAAMPGPGSSWRQALWLLLAMLAVVALCIWSVPGEAQLLRNLLGSGGGAPSAPVKSGMFSAPLSIPTPEGDRFFLVYAPRDYRPGNPVLLALHGGSLSYEIAMEPGNPFAAIVDLADEHGYLLILPNGTNGLLAPGSPGWADGRSNKTWNDCRPSPGRVADDVGFLSDLIAHATDTDGPYRADPEQVFVIGQSNGGFMAQRMALERPQLLRAVGSALANVAADSECVPAGRAVPIALVNGDQDLLVPWRGTADADGSCPALSLSLTGCMLSAEASRDFWVAYNGNAAAARVDRQLTNVTSSDAGSTLREMRYDRRPGSFTKPSPAPVVFYRANRAGHVEPSLLYRIGTAGKAAFGNQNQDAEGYGLIWSFFESLPAAN